MRRKLAAEPHLDAVIARIAGRQHGVIATRQMLAAGIGESAIRLRVRAGRLHRIHHGVYAVGHPALSDEGRWMAAVLACGEGAVLSYRSAAELWGMLKPQPGPVHVTIRVSSGRARRRGIRHHRSHSLPPAHEVRHEGIPVTSPARTIADLRQAIPAWELRRAIRQANFDGLNIGDENLHDGTRSDLERDFLRLCRRFGIPQPEVNVPIGPYTVDFLWRDRRLVVETDGWAAHRGRQAFEDDRVRDAYLRRARFEVVRFADRQVGEDPEAVAATVLAALS